MTRRKRPPVNPTRDHGIEQEITVDAYTEDERTLGWYYHLESKLKFPFIARCVDARKGSTLKKGETVEVTAMAPEDDCMRDAGVGAGRGDIGACVRRAAGSVAAGQGRRAHTRGRGGLVLLGGAGYGGRRAKCKALALTIASDACTHIHCGFRFAINIM